METALDDVATTRDHISDNPDMNNSNAFKDDERYPMNQTMSDDKAMQLKSGKDITLTDLIMHKVEDQSKSKILHIMIK